SLMPVMPASASRNPVRPGRVLFRGRVPAGYLLRLDERDEWHLEPELEREKVAPSPACVPRWPPRGWRWRPARAVAAAAVAWAVLGAGYFSGAIGNSPHGPAHSAVSDSTSPAGVAPPAGPPAVAPERGPVGEAFEAAATATAAVASPAIVPAAL